MDRRKVDSLVTAIKQAMPAGDGTAQERFTALWFAVTDERSARSPASRRGVPIAAVQTALRHLAEEPPCPRSRDGNGRALKALQGAAPGLR